MEANTSIMLSLVTFAWICFWIFIISKQTKPLEQCCFSHEMSNFSNYSLSIIDCKIVHIEQDIANLQNEVYKLKVLNKKGKQ